MQQVLLDLLLAGLMGMLGQGARVIVGLKTMNDYAVTSGVDREDLFRAARLLVSLMIGFIAGLGAAFAIGLNKIGAVTETNFQVLFGLAAAGYVGVDAIEGFLAGYLPGGKPVPGGGLQASQKESAKTDDAAKAPSPAPPANRALDPAALSAMVQQPSLQRAPEQSSPQPAAVMPLSIKKAQDLLAACETSSPRITYKYDSKVPFVGAIPGKDFTTLDCSGFMYDLIRTSTTPVVDFPDGSAVQHQWVSRNGYKSSSVLDGLMHDDVVRIAFLPPGESTDAIGHVAMIYNGKTIECHGGVGPDSRPWTGTGWQAKTDVYELTGPTTG